jgi:GNAT superfamily N-acetyltransferase
LTRLNLSVTDTPPPDAFEAVWQPMVRFSESKVGPANVRMLAVLLSDPSTNEVIGGLWGRTFWGVCHIDVMFVPEAERGAGLGARVMAAAEEEATRRGCRLVHLDTYEFQARPFYEKLGYTVFGQLDGPPPIYPRYYMHKHLEEPSQDG